MPTDAAETPLQTEPTPLVALISVPGGLPDLDATLNALITASPDAAIRIRLPLYLYDPTDQQYNPWPRMSWVVECRDQRLAAQLRDDLDHFIRAWVADHNEV